MKFDPFHVYYLKLYVLYYMLSFLLFSVKEKIEALNEQLEREPCNVIAEKPDFIDSTEHSGGKNKGKRESITGFLYFSINFIILILYPKCILSVYCYNSAKKCKMQFNNKADLFI